MKQYIPYDVELIIYRYLHELYMSDVCKEIESINKNEISIINFFKEKVLYPYFFWCRLTKIKTNRYYRIIIDKYVHKKKMLRVFNETGFLSRFIL